MDIIETEIAESYLSSLEDLTSSSKPLINMLTLLAEENISHSETISNAILHRLEKVESHFKLPILYLIDSIVKNISGVYKTQFSQTIADVYIGAYEKVNDGIRKKMLHLRQTWNDIFPLSELHKIDMKLNRQWPIIGQVVQSSPPIVDLKNKLQQELLQLKIKKLELDLAANQKLLTQGSLAISAHIPKANISAATHIQNYMNNANCDQQGNPVLQNIQVPLQTSTAPLPPAHDTNVNNLFGLNDVDLRVMNALHQPPQQNPEIFQEINPNECVPNKRRRLDGSNHELLIRSDFESTIDNNSLTKEHRKVRSNSRWENQNKAKTSIDEKTPHNVGTIAWKQSDNRARTNFANAKPSSVVMSNNNLNIGNKRLKKIENIKNSKHTPEKHIDQKLINVSLSQPKTLKQRETQIVDALYCGEQCSSCGIRFPSLEPTKYGQHLDWHYRKNRRNRNTKKRAHSRDWFYGIADWLQFEEIENLDEREKNWFEMQQNNIDLLNDESNQGCISPIDKPSCRAGRNDQDKTCDMCHDPFEMFYNEESEEWHLRNAVRVDHGIYHPVCFEDYQNSLVSSDLQLNAIDDSVDIKEDNSCDSLSRNERIPALDADDDDVILLPSSEPLVTEILDDNDKYDDDKQSENSTSHKADSEIERSTTMPIIVAKESDESQIRESEIQIVEPQIPVMDLDLYDESKATNTSIQIVKIKEEPKDDGYAYDAFEDVGTIEGNPIDALDVDQSVDESTLSTLNNQSKIVPSIDGNVELEGVNRSAICANKIKINISKNVRLNKNSKKSSESINNHLANDDDDDDDDGDDDDESRLSRLSSDNSNDSTANKNCISDVEASNSIDEILITENATSDNIEYEIKDSMKGIQYKETPVLRKGVEASGLCSIM